MSLAWAENVVRWKKHYEIGWNSGGSAEEKENREIEKVLRKQKNEESGPKRKRVGGVTKMLNFLILAVLMKMAF